LTNAFLNTTFVIFVHKAARLKPCISITGLSIIGIALLLCSFPIYAICALIGNYGNNRYNALAILNASQKETSATPSINHIPSS
jgi:hypothetical protein